MSGSISLSGPFELTNLTAPASGITKALRFNVVIPSGGGVSTLDIANYIQELGTFRPQAMTIDNTQNNTPVTVNEIWFGWQRVINAGQIVSFNYPAVQLPKFTFTTAAAASPVITLYDFPIFPENYFNSANSSGQTVIVGNTPLPVSFPAPYTANKGVYNKFLSTAASSATISVGNAGLITYLLGFDFTVPPDTTVATAAEVLFGLAVGSTNFMQIQTYVATSIAGSGTPRLFASRKFDFPFLPNLGSQPTITISQNNALATGQYNVNLYLVDM